MTGAWLGRERRRSSGAPERRRTRDDALRQRAAAVIPGGVYGHQSAARLPAAFPQFMARGLGARVWDVDGNEYVDLLCSYGPVILGHHHHAIDAAARRQQALGDCLNVPTERMVELAELLVTRVDHADWAMFAKNGTDSTTLALSIARAATGRSTILAAAGSYHGSAPWCTPKLAGTTDGDRGFVRYFEYNDLSGVEARAAAAKGDFAGIIVTPYRHDVERDQEAVDPSFARGLRSICDREGAVLILDEVRTGFRLNLGGSWEELGVRPDLSAWSKAIANGFPLAALLGTDTLREAAKSVFATGSFWFSAVPMAAGLATIEALVDEDALATMIQRGDELRAGLRQQLEEWALDATLSGPSQMPFLTFGNDTRFELADVFAGRAAERGLFLHPRHNWFVSAAMTSADLDHTLDATNDALAAVRQRLDTLDENKGG